MRKILDNYDLFQYPLEKYIAVHELHKEYKENADDASGARHSASGGYAIACYGGTSC